ncbi:MAG TPA: tetratricopeptide repeat protein, partial [Polyangia bacterium]|nr:tetratricopeptide repeat protein [Polyangia bacterium]
AAYEKGDYTTALQEFERARLVKPLADLDYNIGRCHDRLEHYPQAIAAYQRFVDATNNIEERTEIAERITALKARLRMLEPARPAPLPPAQPALALTTIDNAPPSGVHVYRGPIVLGSLAVASLAVGFGLYGSVGGDYDALESSCAPSCAPSRWSGLQARERAGVGLAIAGGVLAVGDVVWFLVAARRHGHMSSPPRPLPASDLSASAAFAGSVSP